MVGVCLHIGLPKTGSSAIQAFLRANAGPLAELGLHYSLHRDIEADAGGVPNGNGRALLKYLDPRRRKPGWDPDAFERREFDALYMEGADKLSLISSELLAAVDWDQLQRFKDRVIGGRSIAVVAVIRNLHDHAFSTWNQSVKWHAYAKPFDHYVRNDYSSGQTRSLFKYGKCLGWKRLRIVNYDQARRDLVGTFLRTMGVQAPPGWTAPRVNRSLAAAELGVQRLLNRIHGDARLSMDIAERLVARRPDVRPAKASRPDLTRVLADRFGREVERLSQFSGVDLLWMLDHPRSGAAAVSAGDYAQAALDMAPALAGTLTARLLGRRAAADLRTTSKG